MQKLKRLMQVCMRSSAGEFFAPPCYPKITVEKTCHYPAAYEFRFPSPLPSGYPENDIVCGEFHPRHELSAPAVILLSGWLVNGGDFSRMADWAGRSGRNLWVIDIPYHSRRTPAGKRPGELSLTADLVRSLEGLRQLVIDTRVLAAGLKEMGVTDILLLGFSLGGWAGSLLAMVEEALSSLVLVTPVVRADELLESSPYFSFLRNGLGAGDGQVLFEHLGHLFLPAQGQPVIPSERITIVGANEDPLAPPRVLSELSSRWGCNRETLAGGHVTVFFTPKLWRRVFTLLDVTRFEVNGKNG